MKSINDLREDFATTDSLLGIYYSFVTVVSPLSSASPVINVLGSFETFDKNDWQSVFVHTVQKSARYCLSKEMYGRILRQSDITCSFSQRSRPQDNPKAH